MFSLCPYHAPFGTLYLAADHAALRELHFYAPGSPALYTQQETPLLQTAVQQLDEYFAGSRRSFTVPLDPQGTAFQQRVWQALQDIPYGQTCTYGQIARRIGSPGAARAVGSANHCNPLPIFIPCHRVIGADGTLTGYAGGLAWKQALLQLEQSV